MHGILHQSTDKIVGDANKNIGQLMDGSGNVAAKYEYSPFGKITVQSGAYADANPFRFSSEYLDVETGLVYYNFRYYNVESGRWLSRDPIEEAGGLNLYGFVDNDPLNQWDWRGLYTMVPLPDPEDTIRDAQKLTRDTWESQRRARFDELFERYKKDCKKFCSCSQRHNNCVAAASRAASEMVRTEFGPKPPKVDADTNDSEYVIGVIPFLPGGVGRRGAFRAAKRANNIPVTTQPTKVGPNINNQNKVVRGRSYEFGKSCTIRDDAGGHKYPDNPSQNRGPHFNDGAKNHYDYKE